MVTSITHVAGSNRIHKVGTQAMAFDAAGNLSSYAGKTFTHGADGRLRSTTTSAGTVTYDYDGLGRRVSKSGPAMLVPGGFVRYVYDAAHHLIGEYKADGTPIEEYVWIDGLPVAAIETNTDGTTTAYAIETDHLGTPRLLTDATRAPRWRWTSPPFGEVLPEDDPSGLGAVTFNLRFPGQYYDKETGLHYNFNRYYDPGTGLYDQSDPIGLAGGWNTYAYVNGNPLSKIDPLGLHEDDPFGLGDSSQPPFGVPNVSAEAQKQLAKQIQREIDRWFCPPDCFELQQQIDKLKAELRTRYLQLTADTNNLYCTRILGRFSWIGHISKYSDRQKYLQKLLAQARTQGCPDDPEAERLANMDAPQCPAR